MFLKKIEIQGFKSFPDRVALELGSGVTSVVGPNGSGKSNISDAVKWVLGEQSMKSLRGSKIEDIIFSGTESRKPLGFAEVTLVIDNSKGLLPVDFSEVTVTRRVYRSGESEFLINKTQCRLKDISELFMGTGVGKDGYSIIAQGRIDEILSTKSEDRRLIFEEAAGIMKYKVRKIEAERKLEHTKQNLLRINDIVGELENQIEPLRQQSETAKKYLSLKERLKVLEINVFIDSMSKYEEKLKEIQNQIDNIDLETQNEEKDFNELQEKKKQLHNDLSQAENAIESIQRLTYEVANTIEKNNSEIKISTEKIENNSTNYIRLGQEIQEFRQRIGELEAELSHKAKRLSQLENDKENYSSELKEKEKELAKVSANLDSEQELVESYKTDIIDKMNTASEYRNEVNSFRALLEGMEKREIQIDDEIQQLILSVDMERMKAEDSGDLVSKINKEIQSDKEHIKEIEQEKVRAAAVVSGLNKELETLRSGLNGKQSRHRFLCDLEKEHEGYSRSVKGVLGECNVNREFGAGIYGALAQLINVPREYEVAVEMVLGPALQNIATDNEETAKKAINFLKARNLGRATFLPASVIKGQEIDENMNDLYQCKGFIGIASKLVSYDQKYSGIVRNLLGRTILVDNIDNGIAMARKHKFGFRIVTLEGDIINSSGAMSGGSITQKSAGILSRAREIGELANDIQQLEKKIKKMSSEIETHRAELIDLEEKINSIHLSVNEKQMTIAREEEKLQGIRNIINIINDKMNALKVEKEQIKVQKTGADESIEGKVKVISDIDNETAELQAKVQILQEKFKQAYADKDKVYHSITDLKISLSSIEESMVSLADVTDRINKELETCSRNIERREKEMQKIEDEKVKLEGTIEQYKLDIEKLKEDMTKDENETEGLKNKKDEINCSIMQLEDMLLERIKKIELLKNENSRLEIKKSKIDMDMEALQNRIWEEYELTLNNSMVYRNDTVNIQTAQREINKIKEQIKELGVVNVAAIEEYGKTKERYEFLVKQRDDLEESEDKLRKVIVDMTSIMKRQFIEQFNHISRNFDEVFKELFGGGRAALRLADEGNILESGIDIEVQPPGKKLQVMMLLSGGEKALTAIALLFAILKMNPAPFCILDEIEAALDEVNVYRFADYIKKYSNNTQFIIVTHRKGTMEAADTLYGVTMEERGVSKLVSVRMDEKAS